ncbi:hypothetical protein QBC32DRAFT_107629 [Pseudoneurospora amorphoporcata]|uniref:Uncharacterized protein n=1 Tax=Pseudoneurospora amorphoporcata TaxID=241081 RepID=A0AAN6NKW9_9PEZI|nr:hypothetical protein QBC32DRAFT_107629 [Pseudoneurospora amorphoporcata]
MASPAASPAASSAAAPAAATPTEEEFHQGIPIGQIRGPFVHRASFNGTPAEGPYGWVLDWTQVHLGLYRHLALPQQLDRHELYRMAKDVRRKLSGAFPSGAAFPVDPYQSEFDVEDSQNIAFLAEQLRYFEWESSQWELFQSHRQNYLEKDISRPELCRAYYRWLIDSLERYNELVPRSEPLQINPLRINPVLQRKLAWKLKEMYPELRGEKDPPPETTNRAPTHTSTQPPSSPVLAPAAPAPQPSDAPQHTAAVHQPPTDPAAPSLSDHGNT